MSRGTTPRNVRVGDELWLPAKAKAEAEGTTLTAVLVQALRDFLMRPPPPAAQD